jgi:hypothetical protein
MAFPVVVHTHSPSTRASVPSIQQPSGRPTGVTQRTHRVICNSTHSCHGATRLQWEVFLKTHRNSKLCCIYIAVEKGLLNKGKTNYPPPPFEFLPYMLYTSLISYISNQKMNLSFVTIRQLPDPVELWKYRARQGSPQTF